MDSHRGLQKSKYGRSTVCAFEPVRTLSAFVYLLLLQSVFLNGATQPTGGLTDEDWKIYNELDWDERSLVRREWPKEKVESLLRAYREYAAADGGTQGEFAIPDLVLLGDEEAIDQALAGGGAAGALSLARNPIIISKLAPSLYKVEGLRSQYPASSYATNALDVMLSNLSNTPEFSESVQTWARDGLNSLARFDSTGVGIMRHWWQSNEGLFKARKYELVQPGIRFPRDFNPPRSAPQEIPMESRTPEETLPTRTAGPHPISELESPRKVGDVARSPKVLSAAIGISVLAGVVWLLGTRKLRGGGASFRFWGQ